MKMQLAMLVFRSYADACESYCIDIDEYHKYTKLFKFLTKKLTPMIFEMVSGVWYYLKVEFVGNNITMYFDIPIITIEDDIVGIGNWNGKVEFDNILLEQ